MTLSIQNTSAVVVPYPYQVSQCTDEAPQNLYIFTLNNATYQLGTGVALGDFYNTTYPGNCALTEIFAYSPVSNTSSMLVCHKL